jgi:predicted ATP-grasp superfamily ATP-dependent carboligase
MKSRLRQAIDTRTPVVVIYKGEKGALALARTLGRLGVPMYLVTPHGTTSEQRERYSIVEHSRYWRQLFFWNFNAPDEATVDFLLDIANRIGIKPVLFTLSDWAAIFMERHAAALQEAYIFSRCAVPIIERLANKWEMFEIAQECGIPTPLTIYPKTREQVAEFLDRVSVPVVMKTADASLPYIPQKAVLRTRDDALRKWDADAAKGPPNLVVQEYIPGDASSVWMCNAYFNSASEALCVFTGRKLRQISETGVATLAVCEQNNEVAELTKRFMKAVGYAGAVGIGYRYDERDGKYKLLDVNARVSGVFRLFRSPDGADTVRVAYSDLTGQPTSVASLDSGRKWMLEDDLLAAWREVKARKLSVSRWIASMFGVSELHWLARDDVAPLLAWMRYTFVRPIRDKFKAGARKLSRPVLGGLWR